MSDNHNNSLQQYHSTGMESSPMNASDDNADQDLQDVLIELFGPAHPLPFDVAYWDFAQTSYQPPNPSALDYTCGFLSGDGMDAPTLSVDGGSTQLDPSQEFESSSVNPEGTPDEFDNLVAHFDTYTSSMSSLGDFSSSESWDPVMNFSLGFDEKILFKFTRDDLELPVPRREYVVPNTVDTMCQAS